MEGRPNVWQLRAIFAADSSCEMNGAQCEYVAGITLKHGRPLIFAGSGRGTPSCSIKQRSASLVTFRLYVATTSGLWRCDSSLKAWLKGRSQLRLLGLRASPQFVTFAIYSTSKSAILNVETMLISNAFAVPDALKYVRVNILDIIREYKIVKAGIRTTENNSPRLNIARIQLEGVIQEAFASSDLKGYYTGQSSAIASRCGFKSSMFLKYVNGDIDFENVENWKSLDKEQREAVLCAMGAQSA